MAKFVNAGVSIEGSKSNIIVRKISDPIVIAIEGVGRFYKYKSKIKVYRICCDSKLDLNDELDAATIEILTEERVSLVLISNFSNVHGIQGNNVNTFTYAKIIIPWRFILEKGISDNPNALIN